MPTEMKFFAVFWIFSALFRRFSPQNGYFRLIISIFSDLWIIAFFHHLHFFVVISIFRM